MEKMLIDECIMLFTMQTARRRDKILIVECRHQYNPGVDNLN